MTTAEKINALCRLWQSLPTADVAWLESLAQGYGGIEAGDKRRVDEMWRKWQPAMARKGEAVA